MVNARYAASLVRFFFGELHHGVMHLCCDSSLAGRIFGELHIGCNISLVYCIIGALHLWYYVYAILVCYARIAIVAAKTIVQCIFYALFLGLGCNIFLVLHLWCYALSATSRRPATALQWPIYFLV